LEPLVNLSSPLVTLRGLRAIAAVPGLAGVKEYYGLAPDREDPNLRMTGIFFHNPAIGENEALAELAQPYGRAAPQMIQFWRLASQAMELFPWETSWYIREIGRSRVDHSLDAAVIRAMRCHTPDWMSSRHAIFMQNDPDYRPDPWMLEDVQLRCQLAADRMAEALALGHRTSDQVPKELAEKFAMNLADLGRFQRRALAYAYHLREANLAKIMRGLRQKGQKIPEKITEELLTVLAADERNQAVDRAATASPPAAPDPLAISAAIELLKRDPDRFLAVYFRDVKDHWSKGGFSVTSP
jgi:hypothetical protein